MPLGVRRRPVVGRDTAVPVAYVASLSGGMPVTGGFARSIVNFDAAARTRMAGVWTALFLGLVMPLKRTARPRWTEVGRLAGTEVFRNVKRFQVETLPHVLAIRVDESPVFANARWVSDTVGALVRERAGVRHVVLMMSGVNGIDLTGLEILMQLDRELHAYGVTLHLSELKGPVKDRLDRADLRHWLHGTV